MSAAPLLPTKLFIPRLRLPLVERPQLLHRLSQAVERKLTLICAPGGFGKTALLSQWAANAGGHTRLGWVSLTETDNDPATFWLYVAAALDRIEEGLGRDLQAMVCSAPEGASGSLWMACVSRVSEFPHDLVLVLDDYHMIANPDIHRAVGSLLEHLPPQMHLVISSRTDPPISLARLRAAGDLLEVRSQELRFSLDEAGALLNHLKGLGLRPDQLAALDDRTEGWAAGLQMAALALQGRTDVEGFVTAFAGSHRFIVDYLGEEVIERQPEAVRRFLLRTSILDRLTGPLCDQVTGEPDGQAMLHRLEHENLFIAELDDQREWYRYHHLFADVLRARLRDREPELEPLLHQRASAWFEAQGQMPDAVRHALAAGDTARAAELVELAMDEMLGRGEMQTVLTWLESLPRETISARPNLAIAYALRLVDAGRLDPAEGLLQEAEASVERLPGVDEATIRATRGKVAATRALVRRIHQDLPAAVELSLQALDLLPESEISWRGPVSLRLAGAYHQLGDLERAAAGYMQAAALSHQAGDIHHEVITICAQARLLIEEGRTGEAEEAYRKALRLCAEQGAAGLAASSAAHFSLAVLLRLRNELVEAEHQVVEAIRCATRGGHVEARVYGYMLLAFLEQSKGETERAHALVRQAEELAPPEVDWVGRLIKALEAQLWLMQGKLQAAAEWARAHAHMVSDDLFAPLAVEVVTLLRVYIATGQTAPLLERLERLRSAIPPSARLPMEHEFSLYEAIAHHLAGDDARALAELEKALAAAQRTGLVGCIVETGPWVVPLLRRALPDSPRASLVAELLRILGADAAPAPGADVRHARSPQPLLEPLSERELEVLGLVAVGASNQEIADRLFVALTTVKKHMGNIFGKLGATNRVQAITRAKELDLI